MDGRWYVIFGFINDQGEEKEDDLGKISGGFTFDEALHIVQDLNKTEVCMVTWADIKELQ